MIDVPDHASGAATATTESASNSLHSHELRYSISTRCPKPYPPQQLVTDSTLSGIPRFCVGISTKRLDILWTILVATASVSCVLYIIGVALPNWTEFELSSIGPGPSFTVSRNTGLFTSCYEVCAGGSMLSSQSFYASIKAWQTECARETYTSSNFS